MSCPNCVRKVLISKSDFTSADPSDDEVAKVIAQKRKAAQDKAEAGCQGCDVVEKSFFFDRETLDGYIVYAGSGTDAHTAHDGGLI